MPAPNVSLMDLTFEAGRGTDKKEINAVLTRAAEGYLRGVLGVSDAPLVSIDFSRSPLSSVADLQGTQVVGKRLVRVASWYDNEWGFSERMWDVALLWAKLWSEK